MSNRTLNLNDALYEYILNTSLREHEVLKRLRKKTATLPHGYMQIAPEQGQLMALLVELMGAQRTLDIGTFTGYSALAVALALPSGGEVISCDLNEDSTAIAQRYWAEAGMASKITLKLGPALETLAQLLKDGLAGQFDFAFIDADKRNYPRYYEQCYELIRPGGLIILDNVLRAGRVIKPSPDDIGTQTICKLNKQLLGDERITLSLLPVADGLSLLRKRCLPLRGAK